MLCANRTDQKYTKKKKMNLINIVLCEMFMKLNFESISSFIDVDVGRKKETKTCILS